MSGVRVQGLAKAFGQVAVLSDLSLSVPAGSLTVILGPSGCGKTTLLRLIAGFIQPDQGTITIGDQLVCSGTTSLPPERRQIGYVAQEGALFPHLSVADNITFGLPLRARRAGERVEALLDLVGLAPALAKRQPHELSGGQQQRVALARALAPGPQVVLLDEPFSALDAGLREGTRRAVAAALARTNTTAILVTHDQAEALSLATQVAVLQAGRLAQVGRPVDLYQTPSDPAVATFLGDAVLLPAVVQGNVATCALGELALRAPVAEGPAQVLIRPEQVTLVDPTTPDAIAALVVERTYFGKDALLRLVLEPSGTTVSARVSGFSPALASQQVSIAVHEPVIAYSAG